MALPGNIDDLRDQIRDQFADTSPEQHWWAICGVLGVATADGRSITNNCVFSGVFPLPLVRDRELIGRVLAVRLMDDVDRQGHDIRRIVMAGIVEQGGLYLLDDRYPEMDFGCRSVMQLTPDGSGVQFTAVEFAALTAGVNPAFEDAAFMAGTPSWLDS